MMCYQSSRERSGEIFFVLYNPEQNTILLPPPWKCHADTIASQSIALLLGFPMKNFEQYGIAALLSSWQILSLMGSEISVSVWQVSVSGEVQERSQAVISDILNKESPELL
jgi:hypothetical protein